MSKTGYILLFAVLILIATVGVVCRGYNCFKDGAQAYIYGFPLVLMDETRKSMSHLGTDNNLSNHFFHVRTFPGHDFRQVVRANNDTLYSSAWLDLSAGPIVLRIPYMSDRYYVLPFMDAWTNVFDSVGFRTMGSGPKELLVAGPDWNGNAPPHLKLIRSPTNMCWILGRIHARGADDLKTVHALQDQLSLMPLGSWPDGNANQASNEGPKQFQKQDDPSARVNAMSADLFFGRLSRLMGEQPPARADGPVLEKLRRFAIEPGRPFAIDDLPFYKRFLLKKAVATARRKMTEALKEDRSTENHWMVIRQGMGRYGTDYNLRALVALFGLGGLPCEEAVYPNTQKDQNGDPLSGRNRYRIHFNAGKTPPAKAFWSLTMYDRQGFLVDNPIRRYALSDRDDLTYNRDGSLDILIQHQKPALNETNWLPAPADEFAITMRIYVPGPDFLNGTWTLPFTEKMD